MTTPQHPTERDPIHTDADAEIEHELTQRLAQLARTFIADLKAQGHLVQTGGTQAFKRPQEQDEAQGNPPRTPQAATGITDASAGPKAPAPPLYGAIPPPPTGPDTPQPALLPVTELIPTIRPAAAHNTSTDNRGQDTAHSDQAVDHRDEAQARVTAVAAQLQAANAGRLELTHITSDHERVNVHIHVLAPSDWDYWLTAIGAPPNAPIHRTGQAQTATGHIGSVDVQLTAHNMPHPLHQATQTADETFHLAGRTYGPTHGQTGRCHSQHQQDSTPLLTPSDTSSPLRPSATGVPLPTAETQTAPTPNPHTENTP
ncbi:BN159_2729 family protein [Streptomyces sp. JNUCC 63]